MSNQRSFVLFVALVVIVSYLYYESSLKKQDSLVTLHFDKSNFEKHKVLSKRNLLSYSVDLRKDFPRIAINKQALDHINQNTINSKKRLKRETPIEEELLNWKFNVNITKLDKGSKKLIESGPSVLKSGKENSLKMAVFVEGEDSKNSDTELHRAWGAVGEFLRSFFGSTPDQFKENHKILVEGSNFLDHLVKANKRGPIDKEKENLTVKGKEPKFLTSLLFPPSQGSGKENPPLELGSGEIQNLSLDSSNVSRDIEIDSTTDKDFFSIKNLKPEEAFDNKNETPLNSSLENIEISFNPLSENLEDLTPSLNFTATDAILETKFSTKSEVPNQGLDTLFKVATITSLSKKTGNSLIELENFCFNLFKNVSKSPKFLEEFAGSEGSGSFSNENRKNFEVTTTSFPEAQLGSFQRLWNQILRFRFRTGQRAAKMFDAFTDVPSESTDLEEINGLFNDLGSGGRLNGETDQINSFGNEDTEETLKGFSILDCKEIFLTKETNDITNERLLAENVIQPEIKYSSLKINKDLSSDNLTKDYYNFQDTENLTKVVLMKSNDFKGIKISTETTIFPNRDSIAKMEEKIQELINSIGKDDSSETLDTIGTIPKTEDPDPELVSKPIIEDRVSNEVIVSELFTVITHSFKKNPNEPDVLTSENILLNNLNEHKIVSEINTYKDNYIENKEEFIDTDLLPVSTKFPLNEQNQRFFPMFVSGSGSREITDAPSTSEINLNINDVFFELFDLGSGERKTDETEHFTNMTTINELSKFNFNKELNESFSQTDTLELSTIGNLRASNVINGKNLTVHEAEINGTILRIFDTGDGREISIHTNSNQNELNCINCSKVVTPIPFGCANCEETFNPFVLEDSSIPDSYINSENQISVDSAISNTINPRNKTKFIDSYNKPTLKPELTQISETCVNCEPLTTETSVNSVIPQNQIKVTSPDRIKFKKENEPSISTTKFEVWSENFVSKEINTLNVPSNDIEDHKMSNLSGFGAEELNNSRMQVARINGVPSLTPMLSRRGARAHNALPPNWPDNTFEFRPKILTQILQSSVSAQSITEETSKLSTPEEFTEIQYDGTTTINAINTTADLANDFEASTLIDFFENLTTFASTSETPRTVDINTTKLSQLPHNASAASTSKTITKSDLSINPRAKVPQKRFCTSGSECNSTLNERCIFYDGITACDCGRAFKRHPESKKCEATITLKTSLRLPGEIFHGDLKDRSSELFHKKEEQSLETMWLLLEHDPVLFLTVVEIGLDRFDEGSLVVNWDIKLVTDGNETVSELANEIDEDLKKVLQSLDSFRKLPLNVQNASVSTYVVNPCEERELNYCHKSAECILDEAVGFRCKCKMGYLDSSKEKSYPGEACIEFCYPNECGYYGECELRVNGEKHCLCSGWFFGEKCEISGIAVIASFAAVNILVVFALFISACLCRRRRNRPYYNINVTRFQPGQDIENSAIRTLRVADAIALNEVGPSKISKYVNVSTPLFEQGPIIQVTSPSFTGSSIDYDSTFDRSPCSEENSRKSVAVSKC